MIDGKNEFKIKINRRAIAEIADNRRNILNTLPSEFLMNAPYSDIQVALALLSLSQFLANFRIEPDFEVDLNE